MHLSKLWKDVFLTLRSKLPTNSCISYSIHSSFISNFDTEIELTLSVSLYICHFLTVIDSSHPSSTVVLLDTMNPGTSRGIFSEDADNET